MNGIDFYTNTYNPDILLCLANLSNDEVFTPPDVVNKMLDTLIKSYFRSALRRILRFMPMKPVTPNTGVC